MNVKSPQTNSEEDKLSLSSSSDIYTKEKRSEIMSHVRSKNTKPEIILRSHLHHNGFRFRINKVDLPGIPDLVLPKYNTVIFVHGCFWHQHPGCKKATIPKQNRSFWEVKLKRNIERDKEVTKRLQDMGWKVLIVWECEIYHDLNRVIEETSKSLKA